jgi:uncharacterized protein (TIGR03435 family)
MGAIRAFGQAPVALPEFEVASIKPSDPTSTIAIRRSGYRLFTTNFSLERLITWAYDIPDDRLFGKPKWLDSTRYDIVAQALGPPASNQESPGPGWLQQMMQSLLATRFKLAVHRETRERPMYVLLVDKNGPKVHPVESDEEIGQNPFRGSGRGRLIGTKVNCEMLANVLSDRLGRAVEDKTGLKGLFDFTLEWTPDADPQSAAADAALTTPRAGPSIFTAIHEQLGFKLESRKGQVEVIVIDRMESTPTEN